MIDLLLAAALAQGATPVPDACNAVGRGAAALPGCPQWRLIRHNEHGDGFLDPASVRRDGDLVVFVARTIPVRPLDTGTASVNMRVHLDCAARTTMVVHMTAFNVEGGTIFDMDAPASERPEPVVARTAYADVMGEYCAR